MSGDSTHYDDGLRRLQTRAALLKAALDQKQNQLAQTRVRVTALETQELLLQKTSEALRYLLDAQVLEQVRLLEGMVTEGLRAIFHDQTLALRADTTQRYGKVAIDLSIEHTHEGCVVQGDPMDSFGGGPTTITSLLTRIVALLKLKKEPFLVLDETLWAVSDDYIDQTGIFLQKLSATTGVPILLVTHKHAFQDHADQVYQGYVVENQDGWELGLKTLKAGAK